MIVLTLPHLDERDMIVLTLPHLDERDTTVLMPRRPGRGQTETCRRHGVVPPQLTFRPLEEKRALRPTCRLPEQPELAVISRRRAEAARPHSLGAVSSMPLPCAKICDAERCALVERTNLRHFSALSSLFTCCASIIYP